MKKLILIMFLMLLPVVIFAQTEIPIPGDVMDVLTNFTVWVSSFLGVTGLTIFLTALILKIFNVTGSGLKQLISWGTGALLVILLAVLNIGFAKDLIWYGVLAYSVAVSLVANRLFDIKLLESILAMFNLTKPVKK